MNKNFVKALSISAVIGSAFVAASAQAACSDFVRNDIKLSLRNVVQAGNTGGFSLPMWLSIVDETGKVCAVMTSDETPDSAVGALAGNSKWLGSRIISAQKANTANAFSLNGVSIGSGALFAAVQPGASLYGLSDSNPVDASAAYAGDPSTYGKNTDVLVGKRIGGINTFGGGLAVYKGGVKVGAIGVSGDTSCTDHATAWAVRNLIAGVDAPKVDFPDGGGFETLTLTGAYQNLGDHPGCFNTSDITGPGSDIMFGIASVGP